MTRATRPFDDSDRTFLSAVGITLLVVQATERVLGQSLYMIFKLPNLVTVQDLERLDQESRRATLGRLVASVRECVPLDPQFEALLSRFVEDRNAFVHHFGERFDLSSPEGQTEAGSLLHRLLKHGTALTETFVAFMLAFARRLGIDVAEFESAPGYADMSRVWALVSGPLRSRILPPEFDGPPDRPGK